VTAVRLRVLVLAAAGLVALTGLSACGNRHETITDAETEGPYLNVGDLKYQVQVSRQLNPADVDDRTYLDGVSAEEAELRQDETWFAVFVRAVNETDTPQPAAEEFEIEDTEGKTFEPVPVATNPFAYRPLEVAPHSTLPTEGSIADSTSIGGQLVLFKLTLNSLANRPLELRIISPEPPGTEAVVDLDV